MRYKSRAFWAGGFKLEERIGSNASKWTYLKKSADDLDRSSVICSMNHPGIYLALFFWAMLFGSVGLVRSLKNNRDQTGGGYVCPPCGCTRHEVILPAPGICEGCGMPLISVARKQSKVWKALFRSTEVPFYHHKLFYPVNFLAMFIGILALFRFKKEMPMVLFLVFFLSLVLYSFKNQLYGTSYSMYASRRWAFFPISFLLATAPALFLYFSKTLNQPLLFARRDWLHFLPAAFVFLSNALFFFGVEDWRDWAIYNNYDHFPGLAEQLTFIASGIYYSFLIWKTIRASKPSDPRFHKWQQHLRVFLGMVIGVLAVMLVGNFYFFDLMSTGLDYHPVWLVIAGFTLWSTGYLVLNKDLVFHKNILKENRLPETKILLWKRALENAMQTQKPYLNPDLSLQMLAQIIGIKEKDLSEVLNIGFSQGFHDFVNGYRMEEVKKMLLDPEKQHLTNFAMAQESGFNSKSTFFGLFKKYVGMTPGAFKQKNSGTSTSKSAD